MNEDTVLRRRITLITRSCTNSMIQNPLGQNENNCKLYEAKSPHLALPCKGALWKRATPMGY